MSRPLPQGQPAATNTSPDPHPRHPLPSPQWPRGRYSGQAHPGPPRSRAPPDGHGAAAGPAPCCARCSPAASVPSQVRLRSVPSRFSLRPVSPCPGAGGTKIALKEPASFPLKMGLLPGKRGKAGERGAGEAGALWLRAVRAAADTARLRRTVRRVGAALRPSRAGHGHRLAF